MWPFLSSLAQDFIEEFSYNLTYEFRDRPFLSSLAQDFIEEIRQKALTSIPKSFLSSLAQDFIEDYSNKARTPLVPTIPEFSSSGLH